MNSSQIIDYTGQKFNSLTAIKFVGYKETGKLKAKRRVWLFQCDCGNQKEISVENVFRSSSPTKSCGCLKASIQKYSGLQALQYAVYTEGKYNEADITLEQFIKLSQEDCHYCGSPVSVSGKTRQGKRFKEPFTYHGLDRKDNSKGHTSENCVPACFDCNMRKREWNYQEFLDWIKTVYERRIK